MPAGDLIFEAARKKIEGALDQTADNFERIPKPEEVEVLTDFVVAMLFGAKAYGMIQKSAELLLDGKTFGSVIHRDELSKVVQFAEEFAAKILAPEGYGLDRLAPSVYDVLELRGRVKRWLEARLALPQDAVCVYWLIAADGGGSTYVRAFLPSQFLQGRHVFCDLSTEFECEIADYDVFVFERQYHPMNTALAEQVRAAGKVCVFETDDNCFEAPQALAELQRFDAAAQLSMRRLAESCGWMVVTTKKLKEQLGIHPNTTAVIPNMIDYSAWEEARKRRWQPHEGIRIIWAGGMAHGMLDAAFIHSVVRHFVNKAAPVKFVFAGIPIRKLLDESFGRYVEFHNPVPPSDYAEYLAMLSPDIGLAIISHNPFNEGKSDLKWMEYSALGIPIIASDFGPYKESIEHEVTGLLVRNDPSAWISAIEKLVADAALRDRLAVAAKQKQLGMGRDIHDGVLLWEAFFRQIVTEASNRQQVTPVSSKESASED